MALSEKLKQTPILVVDDLPDNCALLEQMLQEAGYAQTFQAASGQEALDLIERQPDIGLVLLDLMMPGMDGYEVARRLSSNPKTALIPIIVVTGGAQQRDEALMRSFECGAMDFIPKPVNEVELYARAKSCLLLYHERRENVRKTLALEESYQRFELAVSGVNDGIWDINFITGDVYYSPTWKKILGYDENEVPNRFGIWENMVHPDDLDRVLKIIHEHWEKRTPFYTSEHRLRTKTGEFKWIFSRGRAVWDEHGKVIRMAGSSTDISQRRALEAQLRQVQQMESIGCLAAGVAHDFNNVLTTIIGQSSLGKRRVPADAPVQENFGKIENAALQAADFCKKMLAFAGQGCYTVEHIDLRLLVVQVAELVQHSINKKISVKLDNSLEPLLVEADTAQLRQVIMNLLINAAEAIGDAQGAITVRTAPASAPAPNAHSLVLRSENPVANYAQLEVQDSGCGMSAEVRDKIFEPFFTTKFTGRGLGLSAVLGIVKSHDGFLFLDSKPDQGTTFRILLKRIEAPAVHPHAAPVLDDKWQGSGTILLVEDEPAIREMTGLMLKEMGFEVILAEDGIDGVEQFRQNADKVSIIILDWNMPRMNGQEALLQIRKIDPKAQVLLASGYSEQEAVRRFQDLELAAFLQKPYRFNDLAGKLRECFEK